jgi:AFG3 family protein
MMDQPKGPSPDSRPPSPSPPRFWLIALFFLVVYLITRLIGGSFFQAEEITFLDFKTNLYKPGYVDHLVIINKERAEVYLKDSALTDETLKTLANRAGPHYFFNIGSVESLENRLAEARKEYGFNEDLNLIYQQETDWVSTLLAWLFPVFLILILFYFMGRRVRIPPAGNIFDFGKSKPRMFDETSLKQPNFDDVAGHESAKLEMKEIVDFLKNPDTYTRLGAKIPKGVILVGPPGTGKTLMARAVAGEANVPFFSISGSEFVEMFVGVGASRVRDLFQRAKEKAPSIIFIDEIDAVGRTRGAAFSLQSNDERESTLNQLLTEMDGFGENTGVIVMAATNRPDILDKALLRPGRFDRHIYLELPTIGEREDIFKVHTRNLILCKDLDLKQLAGQTPGFSGADIANICNEAALIAARKSKACIEHSDFSDAVDRIIGGLEKKGKIISEQEKLTIAHHESGHAVVSWFLKDAEELVKLTIVPRGKSLGAAWYQPQERVLLTKSQLMAALSVAMGGRAAEELIFKEISSGALDDLEKATKQAYTMVAYYGISEKIGNLSYYDSTGRYEQSLQKPYSEAMAELIDQEAKRLLDEAYATTLKILTEHRTVLETLARKLLEKETLQKEDIEGILGKRLESKKEEKLTN